MTVLPPALKEFLARETTAGFLLFAAAAAAIIAVNTAAVPLYAAFLDTRIALVLGPLAIDKPLLLWVNDGLMAVFFFLIGLEVKREMADGDLSSLDRAALPLLAALGGMIAPALVFIAINWTEPGNLRGWAIPAATDIAFALGVLALLGSRVPAALKTLLLAIAIIDDIGAIAIIALFYTAEVSATALGLAAVCAAALFALHRMHVTRITPYVAIGVVLWVCVLKSGVHATLAGVVTALAIPMTRLPHGSPLERAEHALHPWVAFLILPLFAFANAGVSFAGFTPAALLAPLPLGIGLGLVLGKQLGVFGFIAAAIRLGLVRRPPDLAWMQLYGLACLTGIGFTMSLFIGSLAFTNPARIEAVKLGVIAGSLVSGAAGFALLRARRA